MATTTNYGWTTPDDTALVKDGASAIRTLGSSIDTSVKALSPGTTAGDLDYYTAATTKARLGIGTTGQVLTVAGGVPSWASASSGGMTLISTTTLSGASVTISSIAATYNYLYLIVKNFKPATDNTALNMRFNSDSGANRYRSVAIAGLPGVSTFSATSFEIIGQQDNTDAQGLLNVTIPDYANTTSWKTISTFAASNDGTTPTSAYIEARVGVFNQTGAVASITLLPGSGNFTSGTALLYGVK